MLIVNKLINTLLFSIVDAGTHCLLLCTDARQDILSQRKLSHNWSRNSFAFALTATEAAAETADSRQNRHQPALVFVAVVVVADPPRPAFVHAFVSVSVHLLLAYCVCVCVCEHNNGRPRSLALSYSRPHCGALSHSVRSLWILVVEQCKLHGICMEFPLMRNSYWNFGCYKRNCGLNSKRKFPNISILNGILIFI